MSLPLEVFLDPAEGDPLCSICIRVPIKGHIASASCQHIMCKGCYERGVLLGNSLDKCPECKQPYKPLHDGEGVLAVITWKADKLMGRKVKLPKPGADSGWVAVVEEGKTLKEVLPLITYTCPKCGETVYGEVLQHFNQCRPATQGVCFSIACTSSHQANVLLPYPGYAPYAYKLGKLDLQAFFSGKTVYSKLHVPGLFCLTVSGPKYTFSNLGDTDLQFVIRIFPGNYHVRWPTTIFRRQTESGRMNYTGLKLSSESELYVYVSTVSYMEPPQPPKVTRKRKTIVVPEEEDEEDGKRAETEQPPSPKLRIRSKTRSRRGPTREEDEEDSTTTQVKPVDGGPKNCLK